MLLIIKSLLRNRATWILMTLQVAITLAVLVNALALVQRSREIINAPSGMDTDAIIAIYVVPYATDFNDQARGQAQLREDLEFLRQYPGVINASAINSFPGDLGSNNSISPEADQDATISVGTYMGDEHLLDTLGIDLVSGSNFTAEQVFFSSWPPSDKTIPQVIVLSESAANALFPNGDALGQAVRINGTTRTVIGISADWRGRNPILGSAVANIFVPGYATRPRAPSSLLVRVEPAEVARLMTELEVGLLGLHDGRDIENVRLLSELVARGNGLYAYGGLVLVVISALLVFTTALGIFGVAYFSVAKRRRQIGVRRALGATRANILQHFLLENLFTTFCGVVLGSVLAVGLNMVMTQLGLGRADWTVTALGILFVIVMGQVSVLLPAYRASLIDPAIATRS